MRNHEEKDSIMVSVGIEYLEIDHYKHAQIEGIRDGMDIYVHVDELDRLLRACGIQLSWEAVFVRGRKTSHV